MKIITEHIEIIERMDQLIRLQATGTPESFASRLQISKTKLYRLIKLMKRLNAPIEYDNAVQSFVYEEAVGFSFGFYRQEKQYYKFTAFCRVTDTMERIRFFGQMFNVRPSTFKKNPVPKNETGFC